MEMKEKIRKACIEGSYDTVCEAVEECYDTLDIALRVIKNHATEAELAANQRYGVLCSLCEHLKSVKGVFQPLDDKV